MDCVIAQLYDFFFVTKDNFKRGCNAYLKLNISVLPSILQNGETGNNIDKNYLQNTEIEKNT